jgi:hypothetical protein
VGLSRRAWMSVGATAAVCLVLAPAAHGAFGFQGLSASPTNAQAGANSTFNIHIGFTSPSADVKNLTVGLPPGLVGNPTATPLCTSAQLQSDSCPGASQVGTVSTNVTVRLLGLLPLPMTVNGSLYNLEPGPGEPARFGIVLRPIASDPIPLLQKIKQTSEVRLRQSDFGLDTVLTNIPNKAQAVGQLLTVPIDIRSLDIRLNGTVGGKAFMRNPTSCGTQTTRFTASSYANPSQTVTGQASFTSTNCAALPFSPNFTATVGSAGHTAAGTKPPLTTVITQANGEAGLRNAQVLLPSSLGPNLALLGSPCSEAQFRSNAAACPAQSIVGGSWVVSPLLSKTATGQVVIVAPPPSGGLPRLGVDVRGALSFQLLGNFVVTPSGLGQAFTNLPDIPVSLFLLHFKPDGLIVANQGLCQSPPPPLGFPVDFAGWNGATGSRTVAATVKGCG